MVLGTHVLVSMAQHCILVNNTFLKHSLTVVNRKYNKLSVFGRLVVQRRIRPSIIGYASVSREVLSGAVTRGLNDKIKVLIQGEACEPEGPVVKRQMPHVTVEEADELLEVQIVR